MNAHRPRKRFGQHFLQDRRIIERIVDAIAPHPGDVLVEIGPGEGVLTRALLDHLPAMHAVEIDRDLADRLEAEFPDERLILHRGDALDFDFGAFPAGTRVVGNLPYNISTPLLFHLSRWSERWRDLHFMLQREVVDRMVAAPSTPEYGRLSVMLQTRFRMRRLFGVPPGAFRPPPKVESAIVRLEPRTDAPLEGIDPRGFERIVAGAFSARRKTLRNSLRLELADFAMLGIDPMLRAENLSPEDFVRIARHLAARVASPVEESSGRGAA